MSAYLAPTSAACTRIAASQHGLIGRAQALAAGLSPDSIDRLIGSGSWSRPYPRVYALWVPDTRWDQRLMAGALWLGDGSAVSHRAASALWELDGCDAAPLEFSTLNRRRPSSHVIVHRVRLLPSSEVTTIRHIPVTTVARTLVDLGAVAGSRQIELAAESALRRRLTTTAELAGLLRRRSGPALKGAAALRDILDERPIVATESALESLVWRLFTDEGLPPPVRQYEVFGPGGRLLARIDFAYPEARLGIEADGYRFHSNPQDWKRDRVRQNALTLMGWTLYRVTWEAATRRGRELAREVADLLASRTDPRPDRPVPLIRGST